METMGSLRRTNYCGEVSMSNVGTMFFAVGFSVMMVLDVALG